MSLPIDAPGQAAGPSGEPSADGTRRAAIEKQIADSLLRTLDSGLAWRDVTVERIASEAGIKRTLFYVYYPDKNAVLIRLGDDLIASTAAGITSRWLVEADDADGLREEMARFLENTRQFFPVLRSLMEASTIDPEIREYWSGLVNGLVETTAARIRETWERRGVTDRPDPHFAAYCLCRMTEKVVVDGAREDERDFEPLFEAVCSIWEAVFYR